MQIRTEIETLAGLFQSAQPSLKAREKVGFITLVAERIYWRGLSRALLMGLVAICVVGCSTPVPIAEADAFIESVTRQAQIHPAPRLHSKYEEHIRLLCDMMVLAFQTDSTRISTFMLADEGSNRSYRDIGVPDGHHDLSHHGGDPKKHAKIREINRFHVTQLAYLLERLRSIPEGEGTLLDNCMIVYGAGISDGNRHNKENLPVLLAGRGQGTIDTGRHVRYEEETPMCNLFLSMLDRLHVSADFIGDSTGRLPGLTV